MSITQILPVSSSVVRRDLAQTESFLPNEILLKIFKKLPPWDLEQASIVSKQWYVVAGSQSLWKLYAGKIWPEYSLYFLSEKKKMVEAEDLRDRSEEYREEILDYKNKIENQIILVKKELTPEETLILRKKVIKCCQSMLKDEWFLNPLRLRYKYFNETASQLFYSYAKQHRERVVLYPEYLMAMKGVKISLKSLGVEKEAIFNLFMDLKEPELVLKFYHEIDIDTRLDSTPTDILCEGPENLNLEDKLKYFPVLGIFKRLLDEGYYSLIAANLYKCNLAFKIKQEIISNLLQKIEELTWFRKSRILSLLESNLKLDNNFRPHQKEEIFKLLTSIKSTPREIQKINPSSKTHPLEFYKTVRFAFSFFKVGCFVVGSFAAVSLFKKLTITPLYVSPLSLKILIIAGICFLGIKLLEKTLKITSDKNMPTLIEEALDDVTSSQDYKEWKTKLAVKSVLDPLLYKACQLSQIPYKSMDDLQTELEVYEIFYAIHFTIDQFACSQKETFEQKQKLLKLINFLEQWRAEKLVEVFAKRDLFYQNPSYFNKQKHRQDLARQRTQEALQIYKIKKRAREIGLEFPETIQIQEHQAKIEAMALATKEASDLEGWIALLEQRNLLADLLKLAQPNLPPNYRCVRSGKLLFSAVSHQGSFYDRKVFKEYQKEKKSDFSFTPELETSWQLFSAISQVFKNHFNFFGGTDQEIIDCVSFLVAKKSRFYFEDSWLKNPNKGIDKIEKNTEEDLFIDNYFKSIRSFYYGLEGAGLTKWDQLSDSVSQQTEVSAHVLSENEL